MFFRSKIIRARTFYANPKPAQKMQVNQFLCITIPKEEVLVSLDSNFRSFYGVFYNNQYELPSTLENHEMFETMALAFNDPNIVSIEDQALQSLIHLLDAEVEQEEDLIEEEMEQAVFNGKLHLFSAHKFPTVAAALLRNTEQTTLEKPLISKIQCLSIMTQIERNTGSSKLKSKPIIEAFLDDLENNTMYPNFTAPTRTPETIVNNITNIMDIIEKSIAEL